MRYNFNTKMGLKKMFVTPPENSMTKFRITINNFEKTHEFESPECIAHWFNSFVSDLTEGEHITFRVDRLVSTDLGDGKVRRIV